MGPVAYQIALPPSLSNLHPVFHVSQLRQYNPDPSHVLAVDEVQVTNNLTYKAQPQKITDRRMKSLRGKEIALVKVQWGPDEGDSTWELEDRVKSYWHLNFFRASVVQFRASRYVMRLNWTSV